MQTSTPTLNETIQFDSREQAKSLALQLCQQAKQEICFFGNTLDPILFDNTDFIAALSEFSRRSHRTKVHFVVQDTRVNIAADHLLIQLCQRLSSAIHIHIAAAQHQGLAQMFMLVDTQGYLHCQNNQRYQGRACFHDPLETRHLKKTFDTIWHQSEVDSGIRRLNL